MLACALLWSSAALCAATQLSFEDRVAAQRAIEEVYWRHRVWPTENKVPKPPLAAVLSDDALRARVDDYLKQSNALDLWWRRPITPDQLQAELDRMRVETRDPELLGELFDALNNDPYVIAETLARNTLVNRLIHHWYASDERFHGTVRLEAETELAGVEDANEMCSLSGDYVERTYALRQSGEGAPAALDPAAVELGPEEWGDVAEELARQFGAAPDAIPLDTLSSLQEDSEKFYVTALLARDALRMTVATTVWAKKAFDAWWLDERGRTSAALAPAEALYSAAAPVGAGCEYDGWTKKAYFVEPLRRFHTAVWTGSEMIVWGGGFGVNFEEHRRYNPATDSWTSIASLNAPAGRIGHKAVWTGTRMVVWGGQIGSAYVASGGRYDPVSDAWLTTTSTDAPAARGFHSAVWTGTEMIVWGGQSAPFDPPLDTGGRYDPAADTWKPVGSGGTAPPARTAHTAVWTGTEMLVWGGRNGSSYLNSGGRYNAAANSWLPISTGADVPSARDGHTAIWTGTEMLVWGGGTELNSGGRYAPLTDAWSPIAIAGAPGGRSSHTAVWTGAEMLIWGGLTGSNVALQTGGRYRPATDSWVATSTGPNVPGPRYIHTAVWTGREMIVWGGTTSAGALNTGGRYDPATDGWVPTSTSAIASPLRSWHSAIWTGVEMIVWGGTDASGGGLTSGGRYDPGTDAWSPTLTSRNVPPGRSGHSAVWTGTEMIVWGGSNVAVLNTGGRYNPAQDSWILTLTAPGVPSARAGHTAVWSGREMIVWGGSAVGSGLNTGGRYAPSTDAWSSTSTSPGAPTFRLNHTAVWTGTEMIVWGGTAGSTDLSSGGRYNPLTGTWTAMASGATVPGPRNSASAVWTGDEMIVWGGVHGGYLNSGGRYRPLTNSWTATSFEGDAPDGRFWHSAVWTGAEMIVWGGWNGASLNSGARYFPSFDRWSATATNHAPSPRSGHTAVWTGRQMLVWGGTPRVSDLGLYCAACANPTLWFADADGDAYGNAAETTFTCDVSHPPGYAATDTDCDDTNPLVHPGVPEICNGLDDDCDTSVDNGIPSYSYYLDRDHDGYGDPHTESPACSSSAPPGHVTSGEDCNDADALIHPGGFELCNGVDEDCDLAVDDGVLPPAGVPSLTATKTGGETLLIWTALFDATHYDLLTGALNGLRGSHGDFAEATDHCIANDSAGLIAIDMLSPDQGDGSWYLIRPVNCGGAGSYDSGTPAQAASRDPGIAASGRACP